MDERNTVDDINPLMSSLKSKFALLIAPFKLRPTKSAKIEAIAVKLLTSPYSSTVIILMKSGMVIKLMPLIKIFPTVYQKLDLMRLDDFNLSINFITILHNQLPQYLFGWRHQNIIISSCMVTNVKITHTFKNVTGPFIF